jgi:plasmid stabilization system protein ParE
MTTSVRSSGSVLRRRSRPDVYRNRRRAEVRRFLCGIFFEVQDNRIVVLACIHGRRKSEALTIAVRPALALRFVFGKMS